MGSPNVKSGSFCYPAITISLLAVVSAVSGCTSAKSLGLNPSETLTQGYVIDQQQIDLVPVGSSREQVILALGSPSTTATFDNEVFYYISQTRKRPVAFLNPHIVDQRVLAVYFGKDERVTNIANYGLKDGKVFDFVSRTTRPPARTRTSSASSFRVRAACRQAFPEPRSRNSRICRLQPAYAAKEKPAESLPRVFLSYQQDLMSDSKFARA